MSEKGPKREAPAFENDREATPEEIADTYRSPSLDRFASEGDEKDARVQEAWWRQHIKTDEFRKEINDGSFRMKTIKGPRGRFERIEIYDSKGGLLFFSDEKELYDAEERFLHGTERREN